MFASLWKRSSVAARTIAPHATRSYNNTYRLVQKNFVPDLKFVSVERKHIGTSVQKLNLIAHLIRTLPVPEALLQLRFSRKRHSAEFMQVINEGVEKAKIDHDMNPEDMNVAIARLGRGPYLKRLDIKGRGRSGIIKRPCAHLTVVLREIKKTKLSKVLKRPATPE